MKKFFDVVVAVKERAALNYTAAMCFYIFFLWVFKQEAAPLSQLTEGVHLHTVLCPDEGAADRVREALERLKLEEANIPLTPEQLLELEGGPVWLGGSGLNRWDIFTGGLKGGFACFLRGALPMETIGRTWTPYRRRPGPGNGKEKGR